MKRLYLTAAIAAALLPAACKDETADAGTTNVAAEARTDPAMADAASAMDAAPAATTFAATDISAKDFIGEEIFGAAGTKVATVDDVLFDMNGMADKLVFTATDGIFGIGDNKGVVEFENVALTFDEPSEPIVRVAITDEQAKTAKTFDQAGLNDYRLASEIIGTTVDIAASDDDEAMVADLILTESGQVKSVIVQRSAVGVGAGDMYALDFSTLQIEQGDGGLALNVSESELNDANVFTYSRGGAADEMTDDVGEAVDDAADAVDDAVDDAAGAVDEDVDEATP